MGLIAGFAGGALDAMIMRVVDVLLAFPYLLLALVIVAALGPSLVNSLIAIGIVYAPQYARMMRGQVLAVQGLDFVQAATSTGRPAGRESCCGTCCRTAWARCWCWRPCRPGPWWWRRRGSRSSASAPSRRRPTGARCWRTGTSYFLSAWWIATFPGVAILVAVLGFNLLGDALRDQADPRQRR